MKTITAVISLAAMLVACGEVESTSTPNNTEAIEGLPKRIWTRGQWEDKMRGQVDTYAVTDSNEEFEDSLGFSKEKTKLTVVKRHSGKLEVFIENSNLQYMCNGYSNTYISVKFDDTPIQSYSCTDANSNQFGLITVINGERFVKNLLSAKKVTIETEVFQRGLIQQTFSSDPEWFVRYFSQD